MTPPVAPYPVPAGRTARRLEWPFLPPNLRGWIERKCGSPVLDAESQGSGFTAGFASVLTCADGSKHFVKAASVKAQRIAAESYREEARKLAALPAGVPAPRLLWSLDDDWVVLGLEHVAGRNPARPWRPDDLDRCLDALAGVAERLTPPPAGLALATFEADMASLVGAWDDVRATRPDLPHLDEAAALAAGYAEVTRGATLVHTDVRDDNLLLDESDSVWVCDWNWPVVGAAWLDSFLLLIGPRGDGIDVEAVITSRPLLRDVPAEHLDRVLALLTGYFMRQCEQPVPATSPHLREHQAWHAQVCWDWLSERRGWDPA